MGKDIYAHSIEGKPCRDWHRLEDHLPATAKLAGTFASEFVAGEWGYLAGLWHDLGKSNIYAWNNVSAGRKTEHNS